ncbi:GFA family protein [Ephemeroptericola cinctiostellae]|uniref:GFA family protein n=1 Tax=Ephemeroptericola cinctiostellae TaxID=2268024 RepID=UPI001300A292
MQKITPIISGSCLCTAVQFELTSQPIRVLKCHCTSCRKATGGLHTVWAVVEHVHFHWLSMRPSYFSSSPQVQRTFCPKCGTSLTYQHADDGTIDVTVASLHHPEYFPPQVEIWISDQLGWDKNHHDFPQHLHDIE